MIYFKHILFKCNHFGFSCNKMREEVTVQLCRSYNMNYFLGCCGLGDIIHPKSRWPHLFLTFMTPWFHIWLENDLLLEQVLVATRLVKSWWAGWEEEAGKTPEEGRALRNLKCKYLPSIKTNVYLWIYDCWLLKYFLCFSFTVWKFLFSIWYDSS